MRVILLSNLFPPAFVGGYELAAEDIARMLAERGHDVLVLSAPALDGRADPPTPYAIRRTLDYSWNDFEVVPASRRRFKDIHLNIRSIDVLRAAILDHRPDVVCCFNLTGLGGFGLMRFLAACRMPAVAVMMDNWFLGAGNDAAETAALRRWFAISDGFSGARVVVCSRNLLGELESVLGETVPNPVVIPAWVDLDRLGDAPPVAAETVRFLFNSQMYPIKGIDLVLEAAAALHAAGVTAFTVDLFGTGDVARTLQGAHAAGLAEVVRYGGIVPKTEMIRRYAQYDALLFPTWEREPSGFVATEAASAGCIPIITAQAGSSEYLLDEHDCLKIDRSAAAVEMAMRRVMALPASERLAWRRRVRRAARRMFDARVWFDTVEHTLRTASRPDGAGSGDPDGAFAALALLGQIWNSDHA